MNHQFVDNTVATYETKIRIEGGDTSHAAWCTQFIGLRLSNGSSDATGKNGVWFALHSSQIGLRTNAWPQTTYMSIEDQGIDFHTECMLYVEDDMITISVDNNSGEKVVIAEVKVAGQTVSMYRPGEETPTIIDEGVSVKDAGHFNFWCHHLENGNAYFTDFIATGIQATKQTAADANMMNSKDILSDTWVSVDDERRTSGYEAKAATDKKVGIFYFLWHDGNSGKPIYDHSKAFAEGGTDKLIEVIQSGPLGFAHYWAEPYFGYYQSNDEWVIRKHTMQLTAAGVGFIFIDATNGYTYERNYEAILKVWSEMRAEGYDTPRIMFHCGNGSKCASVYQVWNNLYSLGRCKVLWFKYEYTSKEVNCQYVYAEIYIYFYVN